MLNSTTARGANFFKQGIMAEAFLKHLFTPEIVEKYPAPVIDLAKIQRSGNLVLVM
jgi:hypothetical protein